MANFDFTRDAADNAFALLAEHSETNGSVRQYSAVFNAVKKNLAQNDTVDLIEIPANTHVLLVKWEVEVVEGAARNFSIGDSAGATQFVGTTSGNSLAEGVSASTAAKHYSAANAVRITADTSGGLTGLKLRVWAQMLHLSN